MKLTQFCIFVFLVFLMSTLAQAKQYRIYCQSKGVSTEYRADQIYTQNNVTFSKIPWFLIEQENVPRYDYIEQVKCSGNSLVVDLSIKPEWVIRRDDLKRSQAELDNELEKTAPNVIEVASLQRRIEKLKKGTK